MRVVYQVARCPCPPTNAAFVRESQPSGEATVIGGTFQTSAAWAALANGTAAHAIELDDVTTESSLHPAVAVIPAALALAEERDLAPTAFTTENLADPTLRRLMTRTDCFHDPSLDADYPGRWPAAAVIRLTNGRTFSTRVEYATGEPENPVSREGLIEKFGALTEGLIPNPSDVRRLTARVLALDREPNVREVARLLRGRE